MKGNILDAIVDHKREEVAARKKRRPLAALKEAQAALAPPRGFAKAIRASISQQQPAVIAEIKKASPSKGVIRADFDPPALARRYAEAGATCLSILTDERHFQGKDTDLTAVREAAPLPALRKDFIIDPYQVHEARALGADCILLIAAILSPEQMKKCHGLAAHLGMDALVEVHDEEELKKALALKPQLIGINNRDLKQFTVNLDTTLALLPLIPKTATPVAESGIHTPADVQRLRAAGVQAFLVGEALMKAPDPGAALKRLFMR